jgi:23S rRNA (guanine2445-N2)-methyltransferase / 23S rRNA (guanine2069-N7)-methyltransferase
VARRLPLFATCARGTEELLAAELVELGCVKPRRDRGGVRFAANLDEALRAMMWTRIAMRVLYPLGEFPAEGAEGLYAAASQVPWEEHLTVETTFAVDATLRGGEEGHSGFVALKIKDALVDRLRQKLGARPDVDTRNPAISVVAHLGQNKLSLSLDLSGEPLHRRGYRIKPTVAPLKETLAAAILRAVGYSGEESLVDPMCGSGTLLIEGGLIACRRAPGLGREFSVERWPHLGAQAREVLADLRSQARAAVRAAPFPIVGFDKNDEAVQASRRNIKAAGLSDTLTVREGDATRTLDLPSPPGLLVTNPPYGDRLGGGGQKGMKTFYYQLGENLGNLAGWRLAVLSGNPGFESAFHQRPSGRRQLWNGPIECTLLEYAPRAGGR